MNTLVTSKKSVLDYFSPDMELFRDQGKDLLQHSIDSLNIAMGQKIAYKNSEIMNALEVIVEQYTKSQNPTDYDIRSLRHPSKNNFTVNKDEYEKLKLLFKKIIRIEFNHKREYIFKNHKALKDGINNKSLYRFFSHSIKAEELCGLIDEEIIHQAMDLRFYARFSNLLHWHYAKLFFEQYVKNHPERQFDFNLFISEYFETTKIIIQSLDSNVNNIDKDSFTIIRYLKYISSGVGKYGLFNPDFKDKDKEKFIQAKNYAKEEAYQIINTNENLAWLTHYRILLKEINNEYFSLFHIDNSEILELHATLEKRMLRFIKNM